MRAVTVSAVQGYPPKAYQLERVNRLAEGGEQTGKVQHRKVEREVVEQG